MFSGYLTHLLLVFHTLFGKIAFNGLENRFQRPGRFFVPVTHEHLGFTVCARVQSYFKICIHAKIQYQTKTTGSRKTKNINPLKPELNPICCLLALLGAHHFLHVSRLRVKLLTFRLLMSYIYIWSTHS